MNGAEALIRTAVASGVDVCFANPGTTEMHLVAALDAAPGMRSVLGLFEGVVTGAADGYARMSGKPAMTITHLGPGFANGIANLHNARRANSPVVNVIGDQATWHLAADAPLTSDIESLAKPVSAWVRKVKTAAEVGPGIAEAIAASQRAPGGVATLIVPADCAWGEAPGPAKPIGAEKHAAVRGESIERVARALRAGEPALLLLGGTALSRRGLLAAARVAAKSGARCLMITFPARAERGAGLPAFQKLPYFPEQAIESLAPVRQLVLVGAIEPVAFFGYPNVPSRLTPAGCSISVLATPEQDAAGALEALADALGAAPNGELAARAELAPATGKLTPETLGRAVAALQPENAIVVDEAATSGAPWFTFSSGAPPHSYIGLTGGAIGQGLPNAVGAAIACPDRRVISLQADGSGMYT
ncbi:MAG: acetolactate synthase large subunit, partial [bacterium]